MRLDDSWEFPLAMESSSHTVKRPVPPSTPTDLGTTPQAELAPACGVTDACDPLDVSYCRCSFFFLVHPECGFLLLPVNAFHLGGEKQNKKP